jgi:hypothetical protein
MVSSFDSFAISRACPSSDSKKIIGPGVALCFAAHAE